MSYTILGKGGVAEIEVKKSRFIATLSPVKTEEEAVSFVESIRKKYYDARHNCYAYILGEKGDKIKFSDDGEPGGTAGKPIMDVLSESGVRNVCCVVTRYFGGTLLGTGGLVRAYTDAAKEGLAVSVVVTVKKGYETSFETDYKNVSTVMRIFSDNEVITKESVYGEKVFFRIIIPENRFDKTIKEITDCTLGKTEFENKKETEYEEKISL